MLCVKLGDTVVEWGTSFALYLTTKLRNPHYSPEVEGQAGLKWAGMDRTGMDWAKLSDALALHDAQGLTCAMASGNT